MNEGLHIDYVRHIEEVSRIGKRSDVHHSTKIRPIRRLKTLEGRRSILQRAKDLYNSDTFKKVYTTPNLTRNQQKID